MSGWLEKSHLAAEGIEYESELTDEMPTLGSVTCFYNEEKIAEDTLEKLEKAAEESDFYETVYAVDDGSDDGTGEILQEYAEDSDVVEFVQMDENTGKFGAQKFCTELIDEEYWFSIDADSYIQDPEEIDQAIMEMDESDSAAAMLEMRPETEGDGFLSSFYEQMQSLEYSMRRGVDRITSNGKKSQIITASGTATLGETEKIEEAMQYHSGNYAGDDRELTSILELKMDEEVEYMPGIEIKTQAPEKPKEHLEQRRTWAHGQINAISEHPKAHIDGLKQGSRYSAALGLDILGTTSVPLIFNRATEIANSGDIETLGLAYAGAAGIAAIGYTNAALRGETLQKETKKEKTKQLGKDIAGIAAMPIYTTATRAYSIPTAFKDKYTKELTKNMASNSTKKQQNTIETTPNTRNPIKAD